MGIKHAFVSTQTQSSDPDKVSKNEWNDDHEIDGNVDYGQHQALQFVLENRTSDPVSPVPGQLWFRTDL